MNSSIAERLLQVRGAIRQGEFAKALGINPNTLRNYENGRVSPNNAILERICVQFSVNPAWLLLGTGLMKTPTHDGTMRRDGTISHGGEVVREQNACPHCTELYEKLVHALNKAMQTQEQKEEVMKENAVLREENARLKAELSLFAANAAEATRTGAA